jgi:DNA-directed RNA polymerase specialized sigma24 family protein
MNDNQQHPSTATFSSSHDVVSTLVAYDAYIVSLMKNAAYTRLSLMDRDDLAQQVRLKTLGALYEKDIRNLYAYLKSITHNEYISHIRRQKPVLPLPLTDEGEIQGYHKNWMSAVRQGFGDPQVELEEASNFHAQLEVVVRLIVTLPKAQKRVAVCVLRDRIDDPILLAEVFRQHNLDISTLQWPLDPEEKRRLQASYAPVRQKLAQVMNIDLTLFKAKDTSKVPQIKLLRRIRQ